MDLNKELENFIPPKNILSKPIQRYAFSHDASYYRLIPQVVVQPSQTSEIQNLFEYSQSHRIPLVFRAAGTSLSGQSITDGILVDISRHWTTYSILNQGLAIKLQPGIIGATANTLLKPYGRRIGPDPASLDSAMIGGMLANNSSGMCCGVIENAYKTLRSIEFVLPNGFSLDTTLPSARSAFREGAPEIADGLLNLRKRILSNPALHQKIDQKYLGKNTCGYSLNALVDFSDPLEILSHLLIGSEGTLGFIASAVLDTLPVYPYKYTGLLIFHTVQDAGDGILPLKNSGARAIELMDRASLKSIENQPGMPELLKSLPETASALLVEYQCVTYQDFVQIKENAGRVVNELRLLAAPEFTEDPSQQAQLWKIRKGLFPSIGGRRPQSTTVIIEDITFPLPRMAAGISDLQNLFHQFGFPEAIIFGHAKDGNLHFVITPDLNEPTSIQRFDAFMRALVDLVANKYGGALKAEHGTGRNIAPFIETEWGPEATQIMKDLKSLIDPSGLLNPGVIINDNPQAHLEQIKPLPIVENEVDRCMECGFCEPQCPSRRLTLTPRQRIVLRREAAYLRETGSDPEGLSSIQKDFQYQGMDTCAVDGLCGTACPININTGDLVKHLRRDAIPDSGQAQAVKFAHRFNLFEKGLRFAVGAGHVAQSVAGPGAVTGITLLGEKITGKRFFKWNASVPQPVSSKLPQLDREGAAAVYFPSCISRVMGAAPKIGGRSLIDTVRIVAERAGLPVWIPEDSPGNCCGMPFSSKGFTKAYADTFHNALHKFWEWSDHGRLPLVIDSSSCAYTLKTGKNALSPGDQEIWSQLTILDAIEFTYTYLLPRLTINKLNASVILHPNCSARQQELDVQLLQIANVCAAEVTVPTYLGCCGFAGDRGLLFPELTASATELEAHEVLSRPYDGYYSTNLTCEIGMRQATKKPYRSFLYLVEEATR